MAAPAALQLDPRRTLLQGTGTPELLALPIGWDDLAQAFHSPVAATAIESAIERVEDAIGHPRIDLPPVLHIHGDATLQLMVEAAGLVSEPACTLTADAIEGLFIRLTRQAAGTLSLADLLPEDARFAATLVLLRELMHHLRVTALVID